MLHSRCIVCWDGLRPRAPRESASSLRYPACIVVQVGASDLPVVGQIANGAVYLQSELGTAINAFKGVYSAYEDAFCTPAYYTPPAAVPANLTGNVSIIWHHSS